MAFDQEQLNFYPDCAGVYIMKCAMQKVLYIGKAKNLKKRLKQYFHKSGDKRAMIPLLVQEVEEIETLVVSSEVEALILESSLIKKYKPKYNAIFRDDKSYCKILLSTQESWPRLYTLRKKSFSKVKGKLFGPFICGFAAKQSMEIINKLLPLRECSNQELQSRKRPCILYEMGRCLAPCVGKCSEKAYQEAVKKAVRILNGSDKSLLRELKNSMQVASDALEFEKAGELLKLISQVEKNLAEQYVDVELQGEIHVLAMSQSPQKRLCLCLLPFIHGKMQRAEIFFQDELEDEGELYSSFMLQYYKEAFSLPQEILLPHPFPQAEAMKQYFFQQFQKNCELNNPKKGKKHQLVKLAISNAQQALLSKEKKEQSHRLRLESLQEALKLKNLPERIFCFDISHLSQTYPVASLVVFYQGDSEKSAYRKYKIDPSHAGDDYKALEEVIFRALNRAIDEKQPLPQLIIIDGGKGQLNVGLRVLARLGLSSPDVVALVKEKGRHDKGMSLERAIKKGGEEISFSSKDPNLLFLQKIRDEAHRFAIDYQRKRVEKATVKSNLWDIPGIGKKKAQDLLKYFGSIQNLMKAKPEEILAIPSLTKKDLSNILAFIQQEV